MDILTDISNEPDDEESLVRRLVDSNGFDIEGLVATTATFLRSGTREDRIRRDLGASAEVRANRREQAPGFPEPEKLMRVTITGQPGYGMAFVGPDRKSAISRRLAEVSSGERKRRACRSAPARR